MKASQYQTGPDLYAGDSSEGAAWGLLALMSGLSEEHWCAGWLSGLEYSLWRVRQCEQHPVPDSTAAFGMGSITDRQRDLLRILSEEAGGWWANDDDDYTTRFIPMADWIAHVESLKANTSTTRGVRGGEG